MSQPEDAAPPQQPDPWPPAKPPARLAPKRLYFIDWLRVVLTLLVVVQHCFNTMVPDGGDTYWFVQKTGKPDLVLATWCEVIVAQPSMTYAMCMFFMLAGYFTPGSYDRKGPWDHLKDRLIRLIIPVVVYAVVISPSLLTVNRAAGIPADNPHPMAALRSLSYAELWANYFRGFIIAPGPTWFVWCLFWFDFIYVCGRAASTALATFLERRRAHTAAPAAPAPAPARGKGCDSATALEVVVGGTSEPHAAATCAGSGMPAAPTAAATPAPKAVAPGAAAAAAPPGGRARQATHALPTAEYSVVRVLVGMAVLALTFAAISFGGVMATYGSSQVVGFDNFVGFRAISFKPSWLGPNVLSFALGCWAARSNLLRRLPTRLGWWCLAAAAIWWPLAYLMPTYLDHPSKPRALWEPRGPHNHTQLQPPPAPPGLVVYVLWLKLAHWSFSVVWSVGLLVAFRENFNTAPGPGLGRAVIAGAYGAYIIHPLFIVLWAWAFLHAPFSTLAGNAICISPLVVGSSWVATALVRALPGTRRVLG